MADGTGAAGARGDTPVRPGSPVRGDAPGDRQSERRESPRLAAIVERNIHALIDRRRHEDLAKGREERIADRVTRFTGSMTFVYVHLVVVALWVAVNLGVLPFVPRFDETFVILATTASVEAIFLSTFVLISQNRMQALADERADLDLQVSLLAEHEITRLITLVMAISERMGIEVADDPELHELARDVAPEMVLDQIAATERATGERAARD
jgi:uncharacterized membrane protein